MRCSSAVHGELRMAVRGLGVVARWRSCFHVASSRSVSRPGSTSAPCGSFAMVASSVAVAGIEPVEPAAITGPVPAASRFASAAISMSRRSAGSMRPFSARIAGQCCADELQEVERELPVAGRARPAPGRRAGPSSPAASPCRPSAAPDPAPARAPPPGCWRPAAPARARAARSSPPISGSAAPAAARAPARRAPPADRAPRRDLAGRGLGEGDLVLVDVADRHDARQDRGVALEHIEKHLARQPAGAPRRQIDRRGGQRQRIAARLEARARAGPPSTPRSASAGTAPTPEW